MNTVFLVGQFALLGCLLCLTCLYRDLSKTVRHLEIVIDAHEKFIFDVLREKPLILSHLERQSLLKEWALERSNSG